MYVEDGIRPPSSNRELYRSLGYRRAHVRLGPLVFQFPDQAGARAFIWGRRCHHGLAGCVFLAIGAALVLHDWPDRWWKFAREAGVA